MSNKRKLQDSFRYFLVFGAAFFVVSMLVFIIGYILYRGLGFVTWEFLTTSSDALEGTVGILPAILNTLYVILLTLLIALPLGIGAAIYLTEYSTNKVLKRVIEAMVETLAAIPSIIYGLVGITLFTEILGFGLSLYSGCFTMVIMILPTVIRTTQESLKTVPMSYREGALGLGSTKWHMIRTIVLPSSLDGVVTGGILAVGRIVGESAALLFTAGVVEGVVSNIWTAYGKSGSTLSVVLYLYANNRANFDVAFAIASVLMVIVLVINISALLVQRKKRS
ncbi:MAG: phosphate ABC transporter permease PstA [Eubacteriales bacterium]